MRYREIARQIRQQTEYIERELARLNELADQLDKIDGYTPEIREGVIEQVHSEEKMVLSVKKCAKLLGVSEPMVRNLTHRDDFPSIRVGNRFLINRAKLQEWLNNQSKEWID